MQEIMIGAIRFEKYGLKPLSLEEELALPEPMRRTRNAKIALVDMAEHIAAMADSLKSRARAIPVEDDKYHAELVAELYRRSIAARNALINAVTYDGR